MTTFGLFSFNCDNREIVSKKTKSIRREKKRFATYSLFTSWQRYPPLPRPSARSAADRAHPSSFRWRCR